MADGVIVREDVGAVLGALLDIRHELRRIRILLDEDDGEESRKISEDERRALDARYEETTRLLEERIAYHRGKIAEERARRERPLWRRLLPG